VAHDSIAPKTASDRKPMMKTDFLFRMAQSSQ
jgi:hypothetical protein